MRSARLLSLSRTLSDIRIDDVVAGAELERYAFFTHFDSKEHAIVALQEYDQRAASSVESRVSTGEWQVREAAIELLAWMMCPQQGDWLTHYGNTMQALVRRPEVRAPVSDGLRADLAVFTSLLTHGQQDDQIRDDRPPSDLALVFQALVVGYQALSWINGVSPQREGIVDFVRILAQLLEPASSGGSRAAGVQEASAPPAARPRRSRKKRSPTGARRKAAA